jgi:hypothetical protein
MNQNSQNTRQVNWSLGGEYQNKKVHFTRSKKNKKKKKKKKKKKLK